MKYQLDKDNPIPAVDIFNTSKTGMIKPDDDRFANGWAYQDKAFYEYFNFFWNETSTSLNQVNPFLKSLDEEITEIKTQLTQASGGSIQFDTTQNNWFANSFMWLKGLIDKEVTDRTNAIKTASDSLSETINAKDSNLKSLISTETSERKSADTALGTKIDNEVTARTNADKTINDSLANKADKATTLAGYGITDGATKTDVSNASVEDRKWGNITGKPLNYNPAGTIIWFSGKILPSGYLVCNGQSLKKATYANLFDAIGYTYGGSGDNFNVPNLSDGNGRFIRATTDFSKVGTKQDDAIRNITGSVGNILLDYENSITQTGALSLSNQIDVWRKEGSYTTFSTNRKIYFDASKVVPTSTDNRPYNIALVPLISY